MQQSGERSILGSVAYLTVREVHKMRVHRSVARYSKSESVLSPMFYATLGLILNNRGKPVRFYDLHWDTVLSGNFNTVVLNGDPFDDPCPGFV